MNKRDFSIIFSGEYEHLFTNENITCEQYNGITKCLIPS